MSIQFVDLSNRRSPGSSEVRTYKICFLSGLPTPSRDSGLGSRVGATGPSLGQGPGGLWSLVQWSVDPGRQWYYYVVVLRCHVQLSWFKVQTSRLQAFKVDRSQPHRLCEDSGFFGFWFQDSSSEVSRKTVCVPLDFFLLGKIIFEKAWKEYLERED